MLYITGIHALNLPCKLYTCGDWHSTSIDWSSPNIADSEKSIYGDYGIEKNVKINFLDSNKTYNVANHIRALLDLMLQNKFNIAQGMRDDFICNDDYTNEILKKVSAMKQCSNGKQVDKFMSNEYMMIWLQFKKANNL